MLHCCYFSTRSPQVITKKPEPATVSNFMLMDDEDFDDFCDFDIEPTCKKGRYIHIYIYFLAYCVYRHAYI